jgi:hypothetical protein
MSLLVVVLLCLWRSTRLRLRIGSLCWTVEHSLVHADRVDTPRRLDCGTP